MTRIFLVMLLLVAQTVALPAATFNFQLFRAGGDGTAQIFRDSEENPTHEYFLITLAGSDTGSFGSVNTRLLTLVPEHNPHQLSWDYYEPRPNDPWKVQGYWSYLQHNGAACCGSMGPPNARNPFGYVINGRETQLTRTDGPGIQSGHFSFLLNPGDTFGWYVESEWDYGGRAIATISAIIYPAPIPLPTPMVLLLAGLGALGLLGRRRPNA